MGRRNDSSKYKDFILYLLVGGLTTLVNFIVFIGLHQGLGLHYVWADLLAIGLAIVFAYLMNRSLVFQSKKTGVKALLKEFTHFISFRLLTAGMEIGLLILLVEWAQLPALFSKILIQILVVISNYLASKYIVFRPPQP